MLCISQACCKVLCQTYGSGLIAVDVLYQRCCTRHIVLDVLFQTHSLDVLHQTCCRGHLVLDVLQKCCVRRIVVDDSHQRCCIRCFALDVLYWSHCITRIVIDMSYFTYCRPSEALGQTLRGSGADSQKLRRGSGRHWGRPGAGQAPQPPKGVSGSELLLKTVVS